MPENSSRWQSYIRHCSALRYTSLTVCYEDIHKTDTEVFPLKSDTKTEKTTRDSVYPNNNNTHIKVGGNFLFIPICGMFLIP